MQGVVEINALEASQNYPKYVDIIIPAYNEEKRIKPVLDDISNFINENKLSWRIFISVDGNDGTVNIIKKYQETCAFIFYNKSEERNGKGKAIKRILLKYQNILNDIILIMDADNSIKFIDIINNLNQIKYCDTLLFNRYNKRNKIPFYRYFLGKSFNILIKGIFHLNINDTQTGYKVFKKNALMDSINKVSTCGTFFDVSLLYHIKKENYRISEIDASTYNHNKNSTFKVFTLTFNMFISIIAFRLRHSNVYNYIPEKIKSKLLHIYFKLVKY